MRRLLVGTIIAFMLSGFGVAVTAAPAHALSCPADDLACFYKDANFKENYLNSQIPNGNHNAYPGYHGWKATSVRNRTNCYLRLYDGYNFTGNYIDIAPNTEVANLGITYGGYWNDRVISHRFPYQPNWTC